MQSNSAGFRKMDSLSSESCKTETAAAEEKPAVENKLGE